MKNKTSPPNSLEDFEDRLAPAELFRERRAVYSIFSGTAALKASFASAFAIWLGPRIRLSREPLASRSSLIVWAYCAGRTQLPAHHVFVSAAAGSPGGACCPDAAQGPPTFRRNQLREIDFLQLSRAGTQSRSRSGTASIVSAGSLPNDAASTRRAQAKVGGNSTVTSSLAVWIATHEGDRDAVEFVRSLYATPLER